MLEPDNIDNYNVEDPCVILRPENFGCVGVVVQDANGKVLRVSTNQSVQEKEPFTVCDKRVLLFNQFTIEELCELVSKAQ